MITLLICNINTGDVVKNWKKRWVILYEDTLYYFRSKPNPTDVV